MLIHRARLWPPDPPVVSVLSSPQELSLAKLLAKGPHEGWSGREWRLYAEFLRDEGAKLARQLVRCREQIRELESRLSRGQIKPPKWLPADGLPVTVLSKPMRKRGRPQQNKQFPTEVRARGALAILDEWKAAGKKFGCTKKEALREWYARQGQRRSRADRDTAAEKKMTALARQAKKAAS